MLCISVKTYLQALYCDVRQLMTYVKEAHGGVFRRVALSGLLDSANRPHRKEPNMQTTRVVRYVSSVTYRYMFIHLLVDRVTTEII
jgi:hypothetical protein